MPRGRSTKSKLTKACQTDPVILTEQEVEKIIIQHVSDLKNKLETLESKIRNAKLTDTVMELQQLMIPYAKKTQDDVDEVRSTTDKLSNDLTSLDHLQQSAEVCIEQLQEQVESLGEDVQKNSDSIDKYLQDSNVRCTELQDKLDDLEQQSRLQNLRIVGLEEIDGENTAESVAEFAKTQMKIDVKPSELRWAYVHQDPTHDYDSKKS